MIIISYLLIAAAALIEVLGYIFRSYDFSDESIVEKIRHILHPGVWLCINGIDKIKQFYFIRNVSSTDNYYERIYIGEDVDKIKKTKRAAPGVYAMLFILLSSMVNIYFVRTDFYGTKNVVELTRPETGDETVNLNLVYEDEEYPIEINLSEIYPTMDQMKEKLEEVKEGLPKLILGDNESLEAIYSDLTLENSYDDSSASISWTSSDSSIIDSSGNVYNSSIAVPVNVTLTAYIEYYDLEEETELELMVYPADDRSVLVTKVDALIEEELEKSKYEEKVELPESVDGEDISFRTVNDTYEGVIIIFGIFLAVIMIPYSLETHKNKLRERNLQLITDYSEIVGTLIMYLEAGLTIRCTFERIAAAYEKEKKLHTKKRYVYEEIVKIKNEMEVGKSEIKCYKDFGNRCGTIYYIRLASLLIQNIKRGNEDLILLLQREMSEVRRERETEIRKRGEEASIKLLIPMGGMFMVVIVVIVVPAFMSM